MNTRVLNLLEHMDGMCHVRKKCLEHIFVLFISRRGRINFLNMARYGAYSEKTFRTHFEEPFDFFTYNKHSIEQTCSPHRILAGDCNFVPKSGMHTPHRGKSWNGGLSKALPGVEITSLAGIEIETNMAFHLECEQTPGNFPDEESRIDFYVNQIEFLFRDGKQSPGLTHCQARSENKLSFHFNTSLTSVSLAKAELYADADTLANPFSMHDVNTVHFNTLFLDKIFTPLELDPTSEQLAPLYQELLNIGKIAA